MPEKRRIEGRIYLSADQVNARRVVLMHAYAAQERRHGDFKIVFVDRSGGTGKTELINHILETLRVAGHAAVVCATTALAASLYEGGDTVHAMAKLSVSKRPSDPIVVVDRTDRAKWVAVCYDRCISALIGRLGESTTYVTREELPCQARSGMGWHDDESGKRDIFAGNTLEGCGRRFANRLVHLCAAVAYLSWRGGDGGH